jgi:RHS repeat-associated protein
MKRAILVTAALLLSLPTGFGAAPRVGINAANTYFNNLAVETRETIPAEPAGEIASLAAGLENDPALIVAHVRNNFRYAPYYGHMKGPHEVLMDQAGNDYDLARLTVEMLKAANPSNTVSYVRGTITYTLAKAASWLEVDSGQVNPLLNEAGIPHNAPSGGSIAIERIWVRVNGVDVDPAFKEMAVVAPSINLGTAMGYNQNQLLTGALGSVGNNWVEDVDEADVGNRLKGYATALRNTLESTYPNATMADVIGGAEIVPLTIAKGDLASLAVTGTSGITTFTTPDAKRTHTVKITLGTEERIVNMPDIDGRIFGVGSTAGSAQPSGQTPVQSDDFGNAASANVVVQAAGGYTLPPIIQGAKTQYFTFGIGKTRINSSTGGSDQVEIIGTNAGAFQVAATDSGLPLTINSGGSSGLSFATSVANPSYAKDVHVFVRNDATPGSYEGTLKVTDYSLDRNPHEIVYEFPLFATVLPNDIVQLKVGSTVVWSDSALAAQSRPGSYELKVSINHPYPADSGTLGDGSLEADWTKQVFRGSKYVFLTQAGDARWTGRRVSDPLTRCNQLLAGGASQQSEDVVMNTLSAFGSEYLLELELVQHLTSRLANAEYRNYHQFAIAKLEAGYVMDHILWYPWTVGRTGAVDSQSLRSVSSMLGSALEHGSSEEFQDGASISTIKALYNANATGQRIYKLDKTTLFSITGQLTGYSSDDLVYYQQRAADNDLTYVIHQNGSSQLNDWKGHGYIEIWPDGGRSTLIGAGFNFWDPTYGGVATVRYPYGIGWESYATRLERLERERRRRVYASHMAAMSNEPVDLKTGAYIYNMTELTVGNAAPPRGLDFQRSYNSDAATIDGPLGRGWDHNWNSRLQASTDPRMAMGMRRPSDASAMLVACHTLRQLLLSSQNTPKGLVVQVIVANWAVDQLKDSSVSVKVGNESMVFARQPDGTYTGAPGSKMTLEKNGTLGHLLKNRFGTTFTFNTIGQFTGISDIYNKTLTVTWTDDKVSAVNDAYNRQLTFNYGGDSFLDSLTDGTGRTISFTYLNGNLATFTDPDSKVFRYAYDGGNRLQEFRNGENEVVAFNHYDTQGKVDYQDSEGDSSRRWRFFITRYRTVEQNPQGGQTIYEYDRLGRQVSQTDALGNRQRFEYNVHDQLTVAIDAKQQRTEFEYDNRRNLTLTRKFKGGVPVETKATYDALNRQDSVTNANNYSVTYHYNALHEKEWEEDPYGNRTTYTYYSPNTHAAAGQLKTVTVPGENGAAHTTTYVYDNSGHLDRIDYPDNTSEDYTYDARGDLGVLEDRKNHLWQSFYNNRRLLRREVDPNNAEKLYTYNSYGKILTVTDRNGHQTVNTYYPAGRLKDLTNAENEKAVWQYDTRDWQKKVISPLLHDVETTYYANGWTNEVFDPLDRSTKNFYQPNGNRERVRNALLQDTIFGFDDLDQVKTVTNTRNVQTISTLDDAGNTRFLLNGRSQQAESVFDKLNRVTDSYTPLRRRTQRAYSPRGLLTSVTEPSNQSAVYTYDAVGRVDTLDDDLGLIDYDYDDNGNLETVAEGTKTITRQYDDANRLTLYRNDAGEELEYRYYPEGNLWKIIYPDKSKVVEYIYDNANRLKTVKDWSGRETTYNWDDDGRLESIDRENGTQRVLAYDNAGNTTAIREIAADGKLIGFYKFERDPLGRVKHEVRGPRPPPYRTDVQNATFDIDDRMATFNGQAVNHDADGNMTRGPVSKNQWRDFHFDVRNRLADIDGTAMWENVFNAEGIRVETRNRGVATKYVVSPGSLPKTLIQINEDGTRRYFIYGLGLLYHIDGEDTASPVATTTYHYNAQGSTIALSNDSGTAIGRFHYDPYGLVVAKHGKTDTIFQFNGHYGIATDPTGLVHLNARFYNPYLKRFMNSDPAGFAGGMNWFAYSSGDPINRFDPLGLGPADSERYTWIDGMQDGIGALGMFPGLGAIPDGANGVIYLFRGKWGDALFSFASVVPFAGDALAFGKYADRLNDAQRWASEAEDAAGLVTRGGDGLGYAREVLDGGTGRAFAGHGELRYGAGDFTVPEGASISMYSPHGTGIPDDLGRLIESGNYDAIYANPAFREMNPMTHLSGSTIPNYSLSAPNGLKVLRNSQTVEDAATLSNLIQAGSGHWDWAACRSCY